MKTYLIALVAFAFLFMSHIATAQVDLQAEINALLQRVAVLQSQIGSSSGGSVVATGACPSLSRVLKKGMSGTDVSALQSFLTSQSNIYPEGTVSGYFGALTEAAVQRFQVHHGIVYTGNAESTGYGSVGPATRSVITRLCSLQSGTPSSPIVPPNPSFTGCTVGGVAVPHGRTIKMYSSSVVPLGASCDAYSKTRTCFNGLLIGDPSYQYTGCGAGAPVGTPGGSCIIDSTVIPHGASKMFYRQKNLPYGFQCQGEYRTCQNGIMSAPSDYPFATCSAPTEPGSCTLDGVTISHGSSKTFYKQGSALLGQQCSVFGATRTCTNGVLSGEDVFRFAKCEQAVAKTCSVDVSTTEKTVVNHLQQKAFYSVQSVAWNQSCEAYRQVRTCNDGVITGDTKYKYPTCTVTQPLNCTLDHVTVAHNASRTFYTGRSVASTASCTTISKSRTCTNGVLSGSATYDSAVCAKVGQRWCLFDGAFVKHNSSVTAYSTRSVTLGSSCAAFSRARICTDGTLGGSTAFVYSSCEAAQARSCILDGKTVSHNATSTFYSVTSASSGQCNQYSQVRACTDGYLGGSTDFKYQTCDED